MEAMPISDRKLMAIPPADLAKVWPLIRDEVASVEAPDGFIPEDVYALCRSAEATLFVLLIDGERIGWTVLRLLGRDLHIWLLYAKAGFDPMTVFRPHLMDIARNATPQPALKLTFGSSRKGWFRVAPKHRFRVRQTTFECDVETLEEVHP